MTGFFVWSLALGWAAACAWLAHRIGDAFIESPLRLELKIVMFLALLPVPVIDELLAKPQFDQLCATKANVSLHADRLRGRTAYETDVPPELLEGTLVPMHLHRRIYLDAGSHRPLLSVAYIQASGGKLVGALQPGQRRPLTFKGWCAPQHWLDPLGALGVHLADPEPAGAR
ncbi:hypothetical protein [Ramlibacter rhizophilus]|uniref:Uncharacterized protein n=1 Tax=Ramlibacter rhizophilus TaxID=1781167 RepID=A0A4Z0BYW3_9BURK|nr:hypothetical protein [Ramlibacter rhizophilus]TFZ03205.1 hypothetical protein EZ242_04770 [Ramlibacter rhizophilus]